MRAMIAETVINGVPLTLMESRALDIHSIVSDLGTIIEVVYKTLSACIMYGTVSAFLAGAVFTGYRIDPYDHSLSITYWRTMDDNGSQEPLTT